MRHRFLWAIVLGALASACWASAAAAATAPSLVGSLSNTTTLSGADAVAVSGNYAFEVSYWSGQLNVIDLTNPAVPTIVASTPPTVAMTAATNITIANGFAFVTAKNRNGPCLPGPAPACGMGLNDDGSGNSLTIVNISTPTAPVVTGTLQDPTNLFGAYSVAVSGNFAYVASQGLLTGQPTTPDTSTGSFTVLNISTGTPTLVSTIANPTSGSNANALAHATGVAIRGNYAFVTAFNGSRLTTIDITNPSTPFIAHSLSNTTSLLSPNDVVISGSHAYVADQTGSGSLQLAVVDISNPLAPAIVGTLADHQLLGAYRIRARGNFVYVSASNVASVTAVDVSTPTAPRVAGSATSIADLSNVTGLDVSSSGRYIVATSPHLSTEQSPLYPPFPGQTGGPTATGTVSVTDLDPTPIAVTIAPASEPAASTTQTSANFSFAASDQVATFQCKLDNAAFAPCATTASYSSLGVGSHTFTVQATDATGATSSPASYAWTITTPPPPPPPPATSKPSATAPPHISGTAQQGKTLSASTGAWSGNPAPSFSYQWQRCNAQGNSCTSISNQTKTTYNVTVTDVGSRLEVVVTGKNSVGSATAKSASTGVVSWSSNSIGSAKLSHSKTKTPGFSISVPSVGGGVLLQKLAFSLPKGLSFHGSHKGLMKGLVIKSGSKKLAFKLSLKHGTLTLTLTQPSAAAVTLTLSRKHLSKFKSKSKSPTLTLTLSYAGKPSRRDSVKLGLG